MNCVLSPEHIPPTKTIDREVESSFWWFAFFCDFPDVNIKSKGGTYVQHRNSSKNIEILKVDVT